MRLIQLRFYCFATWSSANESKTVLQFKVSVKQLNFMHAHNLSSWLAKFTFVYCFLFCFFGCGMVSYEYTHLCMHIAWYVLAWVRLLNEYVFTACHSCPHINPNVKSNNKTKQFNSILTLFAVAHACCKFHFNVILLFYFCLHRIWKRFSRDRLLY